MDQFTYPPTLGEAGARAAFGAVRERSEALAAALTAENRCIQSMPDASPTNWHLAHTAWFFEHFVLTAHEPGYRALDPDFHFLFNSYDESLGERQKRPFRGLVTRPGGEEILAYRRHVDAAMNALLDRGGVPADLLALGLSHEEQHQELLLTDAMHALAQNPLAWGRRPIAVLPGWVEPRAASRGTRVELPGGIVTVGADDAGFRFDNEGPRRGPAAPLRAGVRPGHQRRLARIHSGRRLPAFRALDERRLGAGVRRGVVDAALLARGRRGHVRTVRAGGQFGPGGYVELDLRAAVRHVSWYEADAFARWAGARLPTEHELEIASSLLPDAEGHVWQRTGSAYLPYPGFRPPAGAIGEYNGKFMINQMGLRGSSFATSPGHARASYRNFFHPGKRWQVTGLRLAHDLAPRPR